MNPSSSDWDFDYHSDSSKPRSLLNGDARINNDNSYVLQSWNTSLKGNKEAVDSEYLEAFRCPVESNSLCQSPSKRMKLFDFESNTANISVLDQTKLDFFACAIPPSRSDNVVSSAIYENQENSRRDLFCATQSLNTCVDPKLPNTFSLCAKDSTDFSDEYNHNTASVHAEVGEKMINTPDAKSPCTKSSSPYACSKCSRTFRTKLLLTHHNDTHDPSKSHRCSFPDCERSFRSQKYLDNHVNDHHCTSSNFKCPYSHCIFVAHKRCDLKRHISNNHKTLRLNQSPQFTSCGTALKEIGERLSDEFFDDAMDVLSRNLNEIYAAIPAESPVCAVSTSLETNAPFINGDHFSPDGTSSTVSAPSFSNGGCVAGAAMTPPPVNIPCSSPASYSMLGFTSHHSQPSDSNNSQWHTRDVVPTSSTAIADPPNGPRQPHVSIPSPFGRDFGDLPSDVGRVRYSPPGHRDSFESNGLYNFNSQTPYAPQCANASSYPTSLTHQPYYHPQPQSTPRIPYYHDERQSQAPLPFATGGSTYGQIPLNASGSAYPQDHYQQPYYFQQQSFYHGSPQRQAEAQQRAATQMNEVSTYPTVSQQLYDVSTSSWPSNASYHGVNSQSRHFESGINASGVFHASTVPPHNPLQH